MSSRFRNELTIVPPVRIKVDRQGLATTIDWSAKGVGRQTLASQASLRSVGDLRKSGPLPTDRYLLAGTRKEFGGGDLTAMTSVGLGNLKALLEATYEREREIRADMFKAKTQLALSRAGKALAWVTLASVVSRPVREKTNLAVVSRKSDVATLSDNLAASRISVSFDMGTAVAEPHRRMLSAFDEMARSQRSWVVQTTQQIDRVRARSVANTVVARVATKLNRRAHSLIDTDDPPLMLEIKRGKANAYFYPGFILVVSSDNSNLALIGLEDCNFLYRASHFTETENVPQDASMVGKVWAKSNKNGTRDKRFRDNRELPVMLYGSFELSSQGGLDEAFMFSRNEACREFVTAVNELKAILSSGSKGSRIPSGGRSITKQG